LRALGDRGLTPGDIDVVVLSHAHWDHVQNADLFPRASVLVHADEPAYAESPGHGDLVTPSWTAALLRQIGARPVDDCRSRPAAGHATCRATPPGRWG